MNTLILRLLPTVIILTILIPLVLGFTEHLSAVIADGTTQTNPFN